MKYVFFGTSNFSVLVLNELKNAGYLPSLIITNEDKPKGRKLILTPPPAKEWAEKEKIPYLQPKTLKNNEIIEQIKNYSDSGFDFFIVASYGKIIPQNILDIPKHKTLNVHPSLLPKLRGPSPIQNAILSEEETGVSIMRLDAEMDHGPIVAQQKISIEWPPYADELEKICGEIGGRLLSECIPQWIEGRIREEEQDHEKATYCKKIEKTDAEINLEDKAEINLRKIRSYCVWPVAYYFDANKKRILIKKAHIENNVLILDRIIPEGKKEMYYKDYLRGKTN